MLRLSYVNDHKYCRRSQICEAKVRQIIRLFVQDLPASKIVHSGHCSLKFGVDWLTFVKKPLFFCSEIEVDESYLGVMLKDV